MQIIIVQFAIQQKKKTRVNDFSDTLLKVNQRNQDTEIITMNESLTPTKKTHPTLWHIDDKSRIGLDCTNMNPGELCRIHSDEKPEDL